MARPRNTDPAQTRARILSAATAAFAESGAAGTSTRTIAAAAGVSLATLHHHFGTKDALYQACVEAMYAEFAQLREVVLAAAGDTSEAWVIDVIQRIWRFALRHRTAVRLTTLDAVAKGIPPQQQAVLGTALQAGAQVLAPMTSLSTPELRLTLRSLSWLLIRYVLADEAELALIIGEPGLSGPALQDRVGAHLGRMAVMAVCR